MVGSVPVPLDVVAAEALPALARRELRTPRQQAARLIVDALQREGLLDAAAAEGRVLRERPAGRERLE